MTGDATVATHIMFQGGVAGAALKFYEQVLPGFQVRSITHHDDQNPDAKGWIFQAKADFQGHRLMVIDSPIAHDFDLTPSMSLFVELQADNFQGVFDGLSRDGTVLMPPDDYGFSRRFAWVQDRFGVSWQINCE